MILVVALLIGIASLACESRRTVEAGFWFDEVTYTSGALGGSVTSDDLRVIEATARAELAKAFHGFDVSISDRRDVRYHVRVVQELFDRRMRHRKAWIAGQSSAVRGFGGSGAVSFLYYASGALVFAPPGTGRAELIEAIGRGIGRGAAHEFAHQLFPSAPIHDSRDRASYEYYAASRPEQYFGEMRWDIAGPLLAARYSPRSKMH
jgi:hypothetical protein